MMDNLIRYASGNSGEVFTLFRQQMSTGEMFMSALIVMLVVFGVLFLMYLLISVSGRVIAFLSGTVIGGKKEPRKEISKEASALSENTEALAASDPGEEFSSGTLKLKGCDEKTAAMIMAIVSDNTGIPLNELIFKSIKLVDKN